MYYVNNKVMDCTKEENMAKSYYYVGNLSWKNYKWTQKLTICRKLMVLSFVLFYILEDYHLDLNHHTGI